MEIPKLELTFIIICFDFGEITLHLFMEELEMHQMQMPLQFLLIIVFQEIVIH